jgi:hypothetical protein
MASGATPAVAYRRALQAAGRATPRGGVQAPLQFDLEVSSGVVGV